MSQHTLYRWFARSAERYPDRSALEVGDDELTYAQLRGRAEALAARIVAVHGARPARVALVASRTVGAYVGHLAIQRLGAGVLPLNPEHPQQRNLDVAQRARVAVALVEPGSAELFDAFPRRRRPTVLTLEGLEEGPGPDGELPADLSADAYLLFTSGSTGRPKGVPIKQRNIGRYIGHNIARYEVGPGSRLSQTFGLTFDASISDMFVSWGAAATCVVLNRADLYRPVDFIAERRLTHWHSVPSVIRVAQQLGNLPTGRISTLRHSLFGAEAVTAKDMSLWRSVAPGTAIHNLYGPTETTITCTDYTLPGDEAAWPRMTNGTLPIGEVYPYLEAVMLGADGRPTDDGELCLRGEQRFDGYLDPAENVGRFVSWEPGGDARIFDGTESLSDGHWYRTGDRVRREDGFWVHAGRLDSQVKVMGHRIELGEVEAVLHRHPGVLDAAVVAALVEGETRLLGAYAGQPVPADQFESWLRERLPVHMIPARLRHVESMPLNDSGKIDRRALRSLLA
ncbi:AMP-binding protein [Micromonospora zamorensis]|uniref:AMP-binding protein n=1 Tax=Micromonospora zamorensis TaxID=709883 RepID=UPI0033FE147E